MPVEVIETIIDCLEFQDLCAHRLTAHNIAGKSSRGKFREYLKSKTLRIAKAPLEEFARFTQPGHVGCLLQQLTLMYNVVPNSADSDRAFDEVTLLVQGMKNLRNNTSHGCLVSRSLSLQGLEDADPDDGYEAKAKLFEITMLALSSSKLPVHMLDIFADSCSHLTSSLCALVCCKIMATMNKVNLSSSFRGCKRLSLRMSHCFWDIDEEFRSPLSLDQAREHAIFICDFVNMFPVLEEFYLAWEYQDLALSDALDAEEHFFDRIADSCEFPFLKKCTLQNIRTSEPALLLFLHKVQLTSLSMKNVFVTNGQFDTIFRYLSTSMPNLDYLHLYKLYQKSGTVYFNVPIERRFPGTRDARNRGPISITRIGPDARRLVETTDLCRMTRS